MAPSAASGCAANLALMICINDRPTLFEEDVEPAANLYARFKTRKTRNVQPNLGLNTVTMSRSGESNLLESGRARRAEIDPVLILGNT